MRITCPGCGSVFDVPNRAVPDPGRDVQCAGCGTSWFLLKGGVPGTGAAAGPARPADRPAARDTSSTVAGGVGLSARPEAEAAPPDLPAQRRVAPEVLAILRAEAETERRARQRAAGGTSGTPGIGEADPSHRRGEGGTTESAAPPEGVSHVGGSASQPMHIHGDAGEGGTPAAEKHAAVPPHSRTQGPVDQLGARDRLARLTAAERHPPASGSGIPDRMGMRDDDEDHGLVEDPGAAQRDPRPPLLRDLPSVPGAVQDMSGHGHLPVPVAAGAQRALVVLQAKRRGFRLGFGATVGACFGALGLYLLALSAGDMGGSAVLDTVRSHGAQVQTTLVDWLRRVVAPALS